VINHEDIKRLLLTFWDRQRADINTKWQRTLPFGDYVVDRWEKAKQLGFGAGASIYDSAIVYGDVKVGANTWVGPHVILDGKGNLEIGENCSIAAGVHIYTHDSIDWAVSGGIEDLSYLPTKIGSRCYIGPNTVIAKGVTIGDGAVIGACSLVLDDVPAGKLACGQPCRVMRDYRPGNSNLEAGS